MDKKRDRKILDRRTVLTCLFLFLKLKQVTNIFCDTPAKQAAIFLTILQEMLSL